jgi:hypothetical protein
MNLQSRIERLEQRTLVEPDVLVVVGEPDAEQRAMLDTGKVRILVQLPDNGRDRRHERTT